eukprot:evm.model.scf_3238.1 EVM.evm.TU.scf_3238.1   scf_3238:1766-2491(+)
MAELGKSQTYVPPVTALLPRMLEMMEHFRDQYNAMQRMIEVVTEADRGKALPLQKMLAQPLFNKNTPEGSLAEDRMAGLEQKIKSLEAENRSLKERYDKAEKQLAQVAAVASGPSANGPIH